MTTGNMVTDPDPYAVPVAANESTTAGLFETTIITTAQQLDIGGGQLANLEVYNGTAPGPTLFLAQDDEVVVRLINRLPHPSGIHWHGIELPSAADGTPVTQNGLAAAPAQTLGDGTPAGGTHLYKFRVPRAGLYWYHPHHFHSTNRVFRQTFGMIVVADPNEATLISNGVLPDAANTYQLVLSDITVCKAAGTNDTRTYPVGMPWAGPGGVLPNQQPPTPQSLCELEPVDESGEDRLDGLGDPLPFAQFDVPNIQKAGQVNEGQMVLTNGVNAGGRAGTPDAPGDLDAGPDPVDVAPGEGIRLQIVNTATTRYFRLVLKVQRPGGVETVPLVRVGGEGGLLDAARVEGGLPEFDLGEILLPPASRSDVVAGIPADATGIATLWTQDYTRTGRAADDHWSFIPTVPVMHLNVTGAAGSFTIAAGDAILTSVGSSVPLLPTPTGSYLPVPVGKMGSPDLQIELRSGPPLPSIDGHPGDFSSPPIYTSVPHLMSTRYAAADDSLILTVLNDTTAHHPFHLHGFSFQPVALSHPTDPDISWDYNEFRDNLDIPPGYTLTAKVHFDNRTWQDGATLGGNFGRWLFHCHIFHHAHKGMIAELVVTSPDGTEKPDVNVHGSWAYAAIPGVARRSGKFSHPDGLPVTLSWHLANGTPIGTPTISGDTWEWELNTAGMTPTTDYVYVTADDGTRTSQSVFRLQVGGDVDTAWDTGDPHIHTLGGDRYDFQAAGEFVLLTDDHGLEIQTRQTPVATQNPISDNYTGLQVCVAVNTAVAARVGKTSISYQPGAEQESLDLFVNGKRTRLPERGIVIDGHRISSFDAEGELGLRIDWVHGPVLQVTPRFWNSHNIWYMDFAVSSAIGNGGLMAPISPGSWLPPLPSGQPLGPRPADADERYQHVYGIFGEAWRVTDRTSLFRYSEGTSTDTFTDRDWPGAHLPCNVKPELAIPGAPVLVGMDRAQAEAICSFLTNDGLRQDCVFDVTVTGDESFAAGYRFVAELATKSTGVTASTAEGTQDGVRFTLLIASVRLLSGGVSGGGRVSFWDGEDRLSPEIAIGADGTATWEPDQAAAGQRAVTARYDGGTVGFNSESPTIAVDIVPAPVQSGAGFGRRYWWIWLLLLLILVIVLLIVLL